MAVVIQQDSEIRTVSAVRVGNHQLQRVFLPQETNVVIVPLEHGSEACVTLRAVLVCSETLTDIVVLAAIPQPMSHIMLNVQNVEVLEHIVVRTVLKNSRSSSLLLDGLKKFA